MVVPHCLLQGLFAAGDTQLRWVLRAQLNIYSVLGITSALYTARGRQIGE
jgi:hypothetical protein